jgi:O-acetylhomoserine/O-acetylserine sulfhydrylase-like pyridoxal-dependent enzyme
MAISTLAGAGDNIVSTSYLYGGVSDPAVREEYSVIDPNLQTYNQFKGRSFLS